MALYSAQDHRGITVSLHSVVADVPPTVDPDAGPADVRRRIEVGLRPVFAPRSTGAQIVPIAASAVSTITVAMVLHRWLGLSMQWGIGIGVAASPFVVIVAAAVMRRRHRHARAAAIISAFLAEHRCPACGYDISAAPPAHDGCTVCPECAAAWRLQRAPGARPS